MSQTPAKICILGGGFGGLYTALRLSNLPWGRNEQPEITLVDARDRFVFSPLLYELVTGELQSWEVAPPYEELLEDTTIRFRQTAVADINTDTKQVRLADGGLLDYDLLVLAMGGETPMDRVPGAAEFAIPFRTISDAYQLADRLRQLEASDTDKIRVAVVGAGYSGIELACKLADKLGDRGRVRVIEVGDQILRSSSTHNRDAAAKALEERGVWTDLETSVESVGAGSISLLYKGVVDTIPVDLVLWTIGTRMNEVVKNLPLKQNERGQILVTSTLQVVDHPEIFAIGDLADCKDADGQQVPATAQAAFQQSDYTGWNLWASLSDRPLLPFRYQYFGEMMTLGIHDATLTGLGIQLEGTAAHLIRRLAYLNRMPTLKHQLRVGFNWITRPIISAIAQMGE
ncbi:NADH dehydrogenase, FAD-containing subunit [Leptolyngbya boryana NIES-2135]|jgi:NADH:ubiquinone reductase (non-electrogenic)|uniref:demethylphylloquinone reductase n=1 Tax=Leptolyngbya boryana NIES-2135 TaxID=1973484 RepID=A0A1Z4JN96_LEPBY|nr:MULTISPECIES: NAD(P)/FAD-dependent oxidoreductase [Leptolyngbya]BAY58180.1 NADH dehydrogenase, FAD-containing subunit [Leptolyngbya boryana NIES-2135]MBD2369162.1 NAD(P)/FAD-dependent oxidoreductase [Leptolyngbya sp. FACHB-161]MBD2375491.1 NAD(P)/FAD-dependent oxidoreductase [Leptolyngbya sp. FACHB-238]MBD2400065.1 NAD(P)/FAD-dependent oxidoreductase [Leptolyngbya sp. FACHB-239]MBD2406425.1 NAD(P)/FAD-dependent oxidoreductase [Leptolyngbya sp. FACHB-402]